MRKPCIALVTAVLATVGLALPATAGASASTRWVSTHTQALHLTGRLLGQAPSGERLTVSAALPLRNAARIPSTVASGTVLTPAQVAAEFSPTSAQVRAVETYFQKQGFKGVSASRNGLLVTGTATVAQADHAFATSISRYELGGKTVYANTSAASVPASIAPDVTAVLGLSDVPMHLASLKATSSPSLTGFTPKAVAKAYDDTSMKPATATTTAIIASGNMAPTIANLRYAEHQFGFPQVPVQVIYDGPKTGIVNDNPLTGNLEWDLDTQISTMVPKAVKQLDIYDVDTFTDPEVARGINMFVTQDKATALSASLGECDYIAFLDGAMVATDDELAEGALQGQSMFASTGDNGYACPEVASTGVPEGPPGVSWPADGEYTTAVGGTTLLASSTGNVQQELAWVGGGGGVSPWETAASWTLQANTLGQTWEYTNQGGRGVPDVAALADPNTPYLVYGTSKPGTKPSGVGGTSVSSPLTMGLWASVETAHQNRAGLAQYDFYKLYDAVNPATVETTPLGPSYLADPSPSTVSGFRDITVGTNGGCLAKPGYDYCTGIGSVQAAALSAALNPPAKAKPGAAARSTSAKKDAVHPTHVAAPSTTVTTPAPPGGPPVVSRTPVRLPTGL
jgi:pseudomonalisin